MNSYYYTYHHKTGATPETKKEIASVRKHCIGQENRSHQMKIYLVTKYIFVDNISCEIVKFEDYWEEVK